MASGSRGGAGFKSPPTVARPSLSLGGATTTPHWRGDTALAPSLSLPLSLWAPDFRGRAGGWW
jgi:hypothetical protein